MVSVKSVDPTDARNTDNQIAVGVSDLSTQGSRVCYRKLYGQLVSNAPFPAP
jgi:hypothetical protein